MGGKEGQPSSREKWGARIRNGGIIAGLIGLVVNTALFAGGTVVAVGGEWLRRSGKSKK